MQKDRKENLRKNSVIPDFKKNHEILEIPKLSGIAITIGDRRLCYLCAAAFARALHTIGLHGACGRVWRIGRVDAFRLEGHGSSRQVYRDLEQVLHSQLPVTLRRVRDVLLGAPLSSSGLEEVLYKWSE